MARFFSFLMMLVLLAVTLWLVGFIWFIGQVPRQSLAAPITATKADLGVVLTGGQGRITQGLITLHEGRIPALLISGVNENVTADQLFNSAGENVDHKLYVIHRPKIFLGKTARSTRGNALEVQDFIKKEFPKTKTILLITTNYHMPRSLHEFREALPEYTILPEPVFSPQFPVEWWKSKENTLLLISEYHKTAVSYTIQRIAQQTDLGKIIANNPL